MEQNSAGIPVSVLFVGIVITMILVNFDSGGTAAVLTDLGRGCAMKKGIENPDYDPRYPCLTPVEQGILGALPFVGLCMGCPVVGRIINAYSEKYVVLSGLLLDASATFIFAYVAEKYHLFLAKFLIGVSHSAICIYTPVWIDHFGPPQSKTTWIGVVQGTAAIGTMVGYAATGYLTACGMFYQNAFRIQAFGLICCALCLMCVPQKQVDASYQPLHKQEPEEEKTKSPEAIPEEETPQRRPRRASSEFFASYAGAVTERARAFSQMTVEADGRFRKVSSVTGLAELQEEENLTTETKETCCAMWTKVMCNRIFLSLTFALCALFFVVTGIQFWMTKYLIVSFERSRLEVNSVFLCVAGSAPILGIGVGGPIIDSLGGYDSIEGSKKAALVAGVWGAIASAAGIGAALVWPGPEDWRMWAVVSGTWVELLFGAAMLPPVTGLLLYSVEENLKVTANATAMLFQNLLGYGIGAYLPGQVATLASDDDRIAMHYAMQVVFFWAMFGLIGMLDAYFAIKARG